MCALVVGNTGRVYDCAPALDRALKATTTESATGWGNYRITLDMETVLACGEYHSWLSCVIPLLVNNGCLV